MLLPQTAEYALRAMAWLSLQPMGTAVRAKDLSEFTEIPLPYLSKILRRLVVAGLLDSQRGHGGGFVLARPPAEISFGQVLDAVDAAPTSGKCAFGWGRCDAVHPCPLHGRWSELQVHVRHWATRTTLADLDRVDPQFHDLRRP